MKNQLKTLDVIALGQTHLDLCGEQLGASLKEMRTFKKMLGGFAPTLATGCMRLGLKSGLISTLSKDVLGQYLMDCLQAEKIQTTHIRMEAHHVTSLRIRGLQTKNTAPTLIYEENAASLHEDDISATFIASSQAIVVAVSAITAISQAAIDKALLAAKENQTKIILALDNPGSQQLHPQLQAILPLCDLVLGEEKAFQELTGSLETADALTHFRTFTNALILLKTEKGCYLFAHGIPKHWQNAYVSGFNLEGGYSFETLAAFAAGFLKGWLQKNSLEKCSQLALACQAISQSRAGTIDSLPSEPALSFFLGQQQQLLIPTLQSPHFSHLHYATTHHAPSEGYYGFSFGYHQQWQKIKETFHVDDATIQKAKILIAQGINLAAEETPYAHLIGDEKMPDEVFDFEPLNLHLVRGVETPNEVPLQFRVDADITKTLSQWPKHHRVKTSLIYHPDDRYALRGQQETTLGLLHRACRNMDLEFLIELTPPPNSLITTSTFAHIIQRLYEVGVYPDWWQLTPPRDQRSWDSIERIIAENDPYCRGVIILSHTAMLEQLNPLFEFAVKQKYCKGFVLGRHLIQPALEQWLSQKIADHTFIDLVATHFTKAILIWSKAQQKLMSNLEKMQISA